MLTGTTDTFEPTKRSPWGLMGKGVSLIDRKAARESFHKFMLIAGPEKVRVRIALPIGEVLCKAAQSCFEQRRSIVLSAPFGIYKSAVFGSLPAWALGNDLGLRTATTSRDLNVSEGMVSKLGKTIVSRNFRAVFPDCVPDKAANSEAAKQMEIELAAQGQKRSVSPWRSGKFFVSRPDAVDDANASAEAVAFSGQALNRRIDYLIADDVENSESVRTLESRNRTYDLITNKWASRLWDDQSRGCMAVLSNCWHEDDIVHKLIKDPRFTTVFIYVSEDLTHFVCEVHHDPDLAEIIEGVPGVSRIDETTFNIPFPTDSEVYNVALLLEQQVNDPDFARKFQGKPASDKDRMFASWKERAKGGTVADIHGCQSMEMGLPVFSALERRRFVFAWGRDFAGGKSGGNLMTLWSLDAYGKIRPLEWHFADRMTSEDMEDIVTSGRSRGIMPLCIRCEDNATQKGWIEEIRLSLRRSGEWIVNLIENCTTGANKMDADVGLPSIEGLFRRHFIEWPEAMATDPYVGAAWRKAMGQFQTCPRFPRAGETPDAPMGAWFAIRGLIARGPSAIQQNSNGQRSNGPVALPGNTSRRIRF